MIPFGVFQMKAASCGDIIQGEMSTSHVFEFGHVLEDHASFVSDVVLRHIDFFDVLFFYVRLVQIFIELLQSFYSYDLFTNIVAVKIKENVRNTHKFFKAVHHMLIQRNSGFIVAHLSIVDSPYKVLTLYFFKNRRST